MLFDFDGGRLVTGTATADARMTTTKNHIRITKLQVAYADSINTYTGEVLDMDELLDVVVFGELAPYAAKIKRGDCILAVGIVSRYEGQARGLPHVYVSLVVGKKAHGFIGFSPTAEALKADKEIKANGQVTKDEPKRKGRKKADANPIEDEDLGGFERVNPRDL